MNPFFLLYPFDTRIFEIRLPDGRAAEALAIVRTAPRRCRFRTQRMFPPARLHRVRDSQDRECYVAFPRRDNTSFDIDRIYPVLVDENRLWFVQRVVPSYVVMQIVLLTFGYAIGVYAIVEALIGNPTILGVVSVPVINRIGGWCLRGLGPRGVSHWLCDRGLPHKRSLVRDRRPEDLVTAPR